MILKGTTSHPHLKKEKRKEERVQKKENLINNLKHHVLTEVAPSEVHGVGVFAIKDIPKGTELFEMSNEHIKNWDNIIDLTEEEISALDKSTIRMIKQCFVKSHLSTYSLPETGPNELNWGYFINHSTDPNLGFKTVGENEQQYIKFVTNRDVKAGEELTEDYRMLSLNRQYLKDQFNFLE